MIDDIAETPKIEFIEKIISELNFENLNIELLEKISIEFGYTKEFYLIYFPKGLDDAVTAIEEYIDQQMLEYIAEHDLPKSITKKIAFALEYRVLLSQLSSRMYKKISAFYINPQKCKLGMRNKFKTCDHIWRIAGDKATDYNYYTKRMLLYKVYSAAIKYYIADDSLNNQKTKDYIARSLTNVVEFGKMVGGFKESISKLKHVPFIRVLF